MILAAFPGSSYQVQYPAPGDFDLALRVQKLLAPVPVRLDEDWGLDHGTWAVLCHVYPRAEVPVVQLSIDKTQPPSFHYEIGQRLAALRDEGVLSRAGATSFTTCTPMPGGGARSRMTGRFHSRLESAKCWPPASTLR